MMGELCVCVSAKLNAQLLSLTFSLVINVLFTKIFVDDQSHHYAFVFMPPSAVSRMKYCRIKRAKILCAYGNIFQLYPNAQTELTQRNSHLIML